MTEQRKAHRVVFEKGFPANIMAIDGTWRRPCIMQDVSDTGARLSIDGSVEGLAMKEFFLLLSTVGRAYRRCELAWVNGDQLGVHFLKPGEKKKKSYGIEASGKHVALDCLLPLSSGSAVASVAFAIFRSAILEENSAIELVLMPSLMEKIYILEDATSPVPAPPINPLPAALDFPRVADKAFAELKAAGMHIVKTSDPIA